MSTKGVTGGLGGNHWCDVCRCWIKNHPVAIRMHEQADGHKEKVEDSAFPVAQPAPPFADTSCLTRASTELRHARFKAQREEREKEQAERSMCVACVACVATLPSS
jgi:hypothetical protein